MRILELQKLFQRVTASFPGRILGIPHYPSFFSHKLQVKMILASKDSCEIKRFNTYKCFKHLKWCLANRKHSQRLSYFHHFITTTIATSSTTIATTDANTITITTATMRTTNSWLSFPLSWGHVPKGITPANLISGKWKGEQASGLHQRLCFMRQQCVPGTVSPPCWPPTTHLSAFSYHIQDHITSPHLTDSFYKNLFTSLK